MVRRRRGPAARFRTYDVHASGHGTLGSVSLPGDIQPGDVLLADSKCWLVMIRQFHAQRGTILLLVLPCNDWGVVDE